MVAKMGRPLSENPKRTNVACRLNKEEMVIMEVCCKKLGMDKSSVLRYGLQLVHNSLSTKK